MCELSEDAVYVLHDDPKQNDLPPLLQHGPLRVHTARNNIQVSVTFTCTFKGSNEPKLLQHNECCTFLCELPFHEQIAVLRQFQVCDGLTSTVNSK